MLYLFCRKNFKKCFSKYIFSSKKNKNKILTTTPNMIHICIADVQNYLYINAKLYPLLLMQNLYPLLLMQKRLACDTFLWSRARAKSVVPKQIRAHETSHPPFSLFLYFSLDSFSPFYLFVCLSFYLSFFLFFFSFFLHFFLSFCLSIFLPVFLSIFLTFFLYVFLSILHSITFLVF